MLQFASRFRLAIMFVACTLTCISVQMCLCNCIGPIPHVGNQCVTKPKSLRLPFDEFPNIEKRFSNNMYDGFLQNILGHCKTYLPF